MPTGCGCARMHLQSHAVPSWSHEHKLCWKHHMFARNSKLEWTMTGDLCQNISKKMNVRKWDQSCNEEVKQKVDMLALLPAILLHNCFLKLSRLWEWALNWTWQSSFETGPCEHSQQNLELIQVLTEYSCATTHIHHTESRSLAATEIFPCLNSKVLGCSNPLFEKWVQVLWWFLDW